ncbi:MAG: GGDEF domain-containing protein [Bryobacteraceae bacterium]
MAPLLQALSGLMSAYEISSERTEAPPLTDPISIGLLETLEQSLSQALELDDPQALKQSISQCLEAVRSEKDKQTPQRSVTLPPATRASLDAVTGLPGRLHFERRVADLVAEGRTFIAALFVVERLPLMNKRFGRAAGDRVLSYVAHYLAHELPESNGLSRWSGSAFAAIIKAENSEKMENQIRAISNKPLSASIDVGNRSVMLTISCGCMMEQVSGDASPESLFAKMDEFLTSRKGS